MVEVGGKNNRMVENKELSYCIDFRTNHIPQPNGLLRVEIER
jgi:hypothetical protein